MSSSESTTTVLLVEDENSFRAVVRTVLERSGLRVLEAGTVKEARVHLERNRPDALLCDWVVPGGDTIALLRETPVTSRVLMTGHLPDLKEERSKLEREGIRVMSKEDIEGRESLLNALGLAECDGEEGGGVLQGADAAASGSGDGGKPMASKLAGLALRLELLEEGEKRAVPVVVPAAYPMAGVQRVVESMRDLLVWWLKRMPESTRRDIMCDGQVLSPDDLIREVQQRSGIGDDILELFIEDMREQLEADLG